MYLSGWSQHYNRDNRSVAGTNIETFWFGCIISATCRSVEAVLAAVLNDSAR